MLLTEASTEESVSQIPHLPMVVMMVPQKKAAEERSQWLVKFSGRLPTSKPAFTADATPCTEEMSNICTV